MAPALREEDSWHIKQCPIKLGDRVFDYREPRFVGRVNLVMYGSYAIVEWDETKWRSQLRISYLRKAKEA